mmetsp:Transcript_31764/g.36271  ORF Transcript_31764/g.36271 Transcript_31764/m.36271 type:complete len:98 (+) Transcript_31764:3-296(+)
MAGLPAALSSRFSRKAKLACGVLLCLLTLQTAVAQEAQEQSFKINTNTLQLIDEATGEQKREIQLDYLYSVEDGGYTERVYSGKLCKASHPDEFFEK